MNGTVATITEFFNNNQLLFTGLGVSAAGIITFWLKDFPKKAGSFLLRQLTMELKVTSTHRAYYDVLQWVANKYPHKNFRQLKLTNGRWGYEKKTTTSIGYGRHWVIYNRKIILLTLEREPGSHSESDKETITITTVGRKRSLIDGFVNDVSETDRDPPDVTRLYRMEEGWCYVRDQLKRPLSSVFIENDKKRLLMETLDKFVSQERWYLDHRIPYQLGVLLYGSPGTGKTSLAKAIASYLNRPIYYLGAKSLDKIERAMETLPDKCVVIVEDIDSSHLSHSREARPTGPVPQEILVKDSLSGIGLSEVLNALDGMFSAHGRILIATTNHMEKLDQALIRPGRIDLRMEIGFVGAEVLGEFINHFFPQAKEEIPEIVRDGVTVASLQNMVLEGKSSKEIIDHMSIGRK